MFSMDNLQWIFPNGYFPLEFSKGYLQSIICNAYFVMDISQWIFPKDIYLQWIFPNGYIQRIFAMDNLQWIFPNGDFPMEICNEYFPMDISKGYLQSIIAILALFKLSYTDRAGRLVIYHEWRSPEE